MHFVGLERNLSDFATFIVCFQTLRSAWYTCQWRRRPLSKRGTSQPQLRHSSGMFTRSTDRSSRLLACPQKWYRQPGFLNGSLSRLFFNNFIPWASCPGSRRTMGFFMYNYGIEWWLPGWNCGRAAGYGASRRKPVKLDITLSWIKTVPQHCGLFLWRYLTYKIERS